MALSLPTKKRQQTASISMRLLSSLVLLAGVSGDLENHRLSELFPFDRLSLPAAEPSDNMYPVLVDCWCERARTGLLDPRCKDWARTTFRWYTGMGVNTLKPTDAWLADARYYWVKEEYCEYTQPWKPAEEMKIARLLGESVAAAVKQATSCPGKNQYPLPGDGCIKLCGKDPNPQQQCFWDTSTENEHVAYRLQQSGFQCKRCPIYLPAKAKTDLLGILDE